VVRLYSVNKAAHSLSYFIPRGAKDNPDYLEELMNKDDGDSCKLHHFSVVNFKQIEEEPCCNNA